MRRISLMYHDVYKNVSTETGLASDLYKISVQEFESHLKLFKRLREENFEIELTFDDGGSSFYHPISHLLDQYQIKGIFFIATKYINTHGFINSEQIIDLRLRGHIIGSHSHSHPDNISNLSSEEIEQEWQKSVNILSKIVKAPIIYASIPNGYESSNVIAAAQKAGIKHLYTSRPTTIDKRKQSVILHGRFVILKGMNIKMINGLITKKSIKRKQYIKYFTLSIPKLILGSKYETIKNYILKL